MKAKRSQEFDDEGGKDVCQEHRLRGENTVRAETLPEVTFPNQQQSQPRRPLQGQALALDRPVLSFSFPSVALLQWV